MILYYAGVNLENLGFYVDEDFKNLLPGVTDSTIETESMDGEYDQGSLFNETSFTLTGILVVDTIASRISGLAQIVSLFQDLSQSFLTIEGRPDRGLLCIRNGPVKAPYTPYGIQLAIPLLASDPFWYSLTEHTKAGAGELYNNGNMSTGFIITLQGPATDPHIVVNNETIIYTGSLTGSDTLTINTKTMTSRFNSNLAKNINGVYPRLAPGSNVISTTSGTLASAWRDCWLSA